MRRDKNGELILGMILCLFLFARCEAPKIDAQPADNSFRLQAAEPTTMPLPMGAMTACQTIDGVIDHPDDYYAVQGNCTVDVKFEAGVMHGRYQIKLDAYPPIKFQKTYDEEVSANGNSISWVAEVFSGAELLRRIPFTFYPSDTPSGRTMSGIYGIKVCTFHLALETSRCTIAKIDRPDRTWQQVGADWSVGQTKLAYYFAEINRTDSWLFIRLESPIDDFEPEMTVQLQAGLQIVTEPAESKPYYLQVVEGGSSAEIAPFYLGSMFTGDMRIIVIRVRHDGRTEGKLPVRVTVRSDTHNFWEDSNVLLATSKNADGSLQITQQPNPNAQTGIPEPIRDTVTPDAGFFITSTTPTVIVTPLITATLPPSAEPSCKKCLPASQNANLVWTEPFVAPYTMHRFDAYTHHLRPEVYPYLSFNQFSYWFLVNNPHVNPQHPILRAGETYYFPTVASSSPR